MICQALSAAQITRLHDAALLILSRTGVTVPHPEMLDRFADAGAQVDHQTQQVRISTELVMALLSQAGRQFTLYGRDLSRSAQFGYGTRNYNSSAGQASWINAPGDARRYPGWDDVISAAHLGDALPRLTIVGAMADPHGVPVSYRCVEVMATLLKHTSKPITFWYHDRASARFLNEMMIALRGDEQAAAAYPVCYPFLEPISPLRFPFHGIDLLFETARLNLPVPVGPMAQMGLTAPMSMAGVMAQQHAEVLAGICITQLVRPGTPVCYGGICHAFDMRTTQVIFGGPEQTIYGVAMTQLGKHLGLPVYINSGLTDAKRVDAQAGAEIGISLALGATAGADIFGHLGIAGADQGASLDLLVLQDEVAGYLESVLRTISFDDETLGLDVIAAVGPGGTFIDQEHTTEHFRDELWFPGLFNRQYYQDWHDAGAVSLEERCRERKEQLLTTHVVAPIDETLARTLDDIVAAARRELGCVSENI